MSFSYNPYRHVELIQQDPNVDLWFWHCHSCGAGWNYGGRPLEKAGLLINDFHEHLVASHALLPRDVEDWSIE